MGIAKKFLVAGAALLVCAVPRLMADAASGSVWDRLAMCESSGRWHVNTGNGYYGGLQISVETWREAGGLHYAKRPDLATKDQQIAVAQRILSWQGWGAWPSCSRQLGLSGKPTPSPSPRPSISRQPSPSARPTVRPTSSVPATPVPTKPVPTRPGPSGKPTARPTSTATVRPGPSGKPTARPSATATVRPGPSGKPSSGPTSTATVRPGSSGKPSSGATSTASARPGSSASAKPTARPSASVTAKPTAPPSAQPTGQATGQATAVPAGVPATYVVRDGDTLSKIAARFHLPGGWTALYQRNRQAVGPDPDRLRPGTVLRLR